MPKQNSELGQRKAGKLLRAGRAVGFAVLGLIAFALVLGLSGKPPQGDGTVFSSAQARQEGDYARHDLDYGISMELPKDWKVLSAAELAGEMEKSLEYLEKSGGGSLPPPKMPFGATSEPGGAGVYVMVYDNELGVASVQMMLGLAEQPDGLAGIKTFYEPELAKAMAYENKPLLAMHPVSLAAVDGQKALLIAYQYQDDKTGTPWEARQYQLAFPKHALELVMVWEESRADAMLPVVEKILSSVKFAPLPAAQ